MMTTFYATYAPASSGGLPVGATQVTNPWIVAGDGTAGSASSGVVTVQGIGGGTPVAISGSITADNASVGATGIGVPASATYIGVDVAGDLVGLVGTVNGLKVDGSAVTQPVSAAALPLPTGAATSAKQPAIGTAGSASTDVLTVQGITSMTPLLVNGSGSTQPVSGTVTVTQATGTNLHAVIDSGTLTTVSTVTSVTAIANALPAGTNLLGKVGIDQTTPGTTNNVTVSSIAPVTVGTAAFQVEGATAAGSVTGSYVTIFTPSANTKILFLRNNTNQSISFSLDAGATTNFVLDSGDQVAIDYLANALAAATSAIQIKATGSNPTTGSVRVNACH